MTEKLNPYPGQTTRHVKHLQKTSTEEDTREITTELLDANVVTSEVVSANVVTSEVDGVDPFACGALTHKPVLDIDMPCVLTESSTPGHHHLYIDKAMTWEQYKTLLVALGQCGVLEDGYVQAALRRKYTAVRLPWICKGDEEDPRDRAELDGMY